MLIEQIRKGQFVDGGNFQGIVIRINTSENRVAVKDDNCIIWSAIPSDLVDGTKKMIQIAESFLGGKIRKSAAENYHLLITIKKITYSVYYFWTSKEWRVFWPYPSDYQRKKDFVDLDSVKAFFDSKKKRKK